MSAPLRVTNQQVIDAYRATGSVWRAAKELGIGGQSVHERLRALDYPMASRKWDDNEVAELRLLACAMTVGEIASRLGRPYAGVAGKISELGIGVRFGNRQARKIPRGAGYDKRSCERYRKQVDETGISLRVCASRNGLTTEMLCQALEKHFPDWWQEYRRAHTDLPEKTCGYCERPFYPSNKKQDYCTRKCAADARTDRGYFGGKRKNTIGLKEGVCQLCGREGMTGLTPHHVLGKENDPDNEVLIALCRGCHQIVTLLGGRDFADDATAWESLISLVMLRRHGAPGKPYQFGTYIYVEMEPLTAGDLDDEELLDAAGIEATS